MTCDLNNPMRFSVQNRSIPIAGLLSDDKRVTEIEISDGQLYVHWEKQMCDMPPKPEWADCQCDDPEVVRTLAKGTPAAKRYCACGGRVTDD